MANLKIIVTNNYFFYAAVQVILETIFVTKYIFFLPP